MRFLEHSIVESRDPQSASVATRSSRTALLLLRNNSSSQEKKLAELFDLFGILWKAVPADKATADISPSRDGKYCVLSCAQEMARELHAVIKSGGELPCWMKEADSVHIFGFDNTDSCKGLLQYLTGDAEARIRAVNGPHAFVSVTGDLPDMCGPMSGMRVLVDSHNCELVFDLSPKSNGFKSIIAAQDGHVFIRLICQGLPFYLNVSSSIIDIGSASEKQFDVKDHFCSAVPITMYLKWAFRDVCWSNRETNACLIIDDPLLKPRYGFLNFGELSELMDERHFTTAIAFIPWNWRRTDRHTVALLRGRSDRFSLAVHGCDHTASEFATRSASQLDSKIMTAKQRMETFVQRTSLSYDRIMVFPQGRFSPETGRALKLNGFIAAVNTEISPWNNDGNETKIRDLWDTAITKYGTFPIFTRRYISAGIENFAFDAILGKPCLIAAHHDVFKGHGRSLADFVERLNSLNWNLCWRPLGDALARSFKFLTRDDETIIIRMFSKSLVIENPTVSSREAVFMKEESDPDRVRAVTFNQTPIDFHCDGGYLRFRAQLLPKETAQVRVTYVESEDLAAQGGPDIVYKVRTRVRRHLCEFRDNYLSRSEFLSGNASRIRQRLRGGRA
jgi:hypothetical protein